jgi:DNA-binding NarL/FixJ family response regulator
VRKRSASVAVETRLSVTEETVKSHVKSIMATLDANDRTHFVTIDLKRGIAVK